MKVLIQSILLSVVAISCSPGQGEYLKKLRNFSDDYGVTYEANVVDTLKVDYLTDYINLVDYSPHRGEFLATRGRTTDTLLIINKEGDVLKKFNFQGQGDEYVGSGIFAARFFQDSLICVVSRKGFYWYDLEGNYVRSVKDRTALLPFGTPARNKLYFDDEFSTATLHLKSPENFDFMQVNSQFIDQFSAVTNYDLSTKEYSLKFNFENNSIYKHDEVFYGRTNTHFTYNKKQKKYYVLHYPDPQLFVYDEHFTLLKTIDLKLDHFPIEISARFGSGADLDIDYQVINGRYVSIDSFDDYVFLVYRNGLPMEEFKKMKNEYDLPLLFRDHMKYYGILLKDDEVVSGDIPLPRGSVGVAQAVSIDEIYFSVNPYVTGVEYPYLYFKIELSKLHD